ncbi:hypothetical protein C8R44DRAFT_811001 [Mycena epipterygia]|nr:hypothetical protein C8R44DRAFT_811001 [Mycena epipterygia]
MGVSAWVRSFWVQHKAEVEGRKLHDRSRRMRTWTGPIHAPGLAQEEYEKRENLSEQVLWCCSEWISILNEHGTIPGTKLGSLPRGI